jgi:DNA-binding SARP family transcriptional activator
MTSANPVLASAGPKEGGIDFRILGPLEVAENGRALALGRGRQRALLGVLLLRTNEVVGQEQLIEALWGESPPPTAPTALHGYVSRLRKLLGGQRIETRAPGYLLRLEPGELDLERFERLVEEGRYREALALWRGPALADLAFEPFAQGEIVRLEELRLAALEGRIEVDLAEGRHGEVVGELESLVRAHPLRERFCAQLMLALYRSGRQAEALDAYAAARSTLVDELGLEPGERLRELQRQILAQDPALEAAPSEPEPARAEPAPAEPARRVRKTVTVLFCDLVGSAALGEELDPELFDELLERYYDAAAGVIAAHGGSVAKYAGDEVMGVFGLPQVHEDDALRAVRAASELPEAVGGLGLAVRIGVNTGEVVAGGEALVTGDPVNLAARLQEAAAPGRIVLGEATWRLARDAIRAEPVDVQVKGKAKPLRGWRLDELIPGAPAFERRLDAPLVGRERALAKLRGVFDDVVADQAPHLFTLVGSAGIGKTRLALEFAAAVGDNARVLVGRCLPYGDGITYWPIVEIGRQLGDVDAEARRLLGDADAIAPLLADAVGQGGSAGGQEEIFWALRRLFEALARERPLVLVFEDIHWAEPTLLELVEHLADVARDAPLLLLCLARPELLEERPGWGGGKLNASSLLLEPLSEAESDTLIDVLLGPGRSRPTPAAGFPRRPKETRCSSSRCWPRSASARRPTTSWPCRRRFVRCSRPASTAWGRASAPSLRLLPSSGRSSGARRSSTCCLTRHGSSSGRTSTHSCGKSSFGPRGRRSSQRTPTASGTSSSATPPTAPSRSERGRASTTGSPSGSLRSRTAPASTTRSSATTSSRRTTSAASSAIPRTRFASSGRAPALTSTMRASCAPEERSVCRPQADEPGRRPAAGRSSAPAIVSRHGGGDGALPRRHGSRTQPGGPGA